MGTKKAYNRNTDNVVVYPFWITRSTRDKMLARKETTGINFSQQVRDALRLYFNNLDDEKSAAAKIDELVQKPYYYG